MTWNQKPASRDTTAADFTSPRKPYALYQRPDKNELPDKRAAVSCYLHRFPIEQQEASMYRKILVAYNGTPESRLALQECILLAPGPTAQVHLLAVVAPSPIVLAGEFVAAVPTLDEEQAERDAMEQVLQAGRKLLTDAGLNVATHLEVGEPVNVIADLVNKHGIELVIVGHSRQKTFAMRWWRGSMDAVLVDKIRCSVLVAADPKTSS
ncbi:MAG TPA: universal stress protein [Noviherbaspirillum sp.]|nr:universal stress protein [Noviherbaspirillum sp.]